MASTSATLSLSSSSTFVDRKPSRQSSAVASPQCVSLPTLPLPAMSSQNRSQSREPWKTTAYCRKLARSVVAMATGDAATEVVESTELPEIVETVPEPVSNTIEDAPTVVAESTELPEIVKTIQEAWDKLDDKYAVTSLAFAGLVAVWGSAGMISAIDRLPLVPGVLELVGIGYSGWFAYRNLISTPDREALLEKIKGTYKDILGQT